MTSHTIPIEFYTKPDCPLCDRAMEVIRKFEDRFSIEIKEIDIRADAQLYEKYKHTIPVIVVAGQEPIESIVDREKLLQQLTRAAGRDKAEDRS